MESSWLPHGTLSVLLISRHVHTLSVLYEFDSDTTLSCHGMDFYVHDLLLALPSCAQGTTSLGTGIRDGRQSQYGAHPMKTCMRVLLMSSLGHRGRGSTVKSVAKPVAVIRAVSSIASSAS